MRLSNAPPSRPVPKRSPHWYIRGHVRGIRVFETSGTDDRAAAETIRIRREAALLERSLFGRAASVSFAEAALSYLEAGGEARFLGRYDEKTGKWSLLIGHFGVRPIAEINQSAADEAARLLHPKAGPATRKRQVYVPLSAVLNHVARKWEMPVAKLSHPKPPKVETKWATPEGVAQLLPACSPRLRLLVAVLVYTGARLSEVLRLNWDQDIDLQHRTIVFRKTKTGRMRTVRIAGQLLVELAATDPVMRSGPMFEWSDKSHVHRPLRNACKRAGIAYLSPHQLGRHTFATWLRIYAGRDLRGLMEDVGWNSIASTVRYAHVVPVNQRRRSMLSQASTRWCKLPR